MPGPEMIEIAPTKESVRARVAELIGDDAELLTRLQEIKDFNKKVRVNEVFVTDACNLRCDGCWFFEHGMDKEGVEVRDLVAVRSFARKLKARGVTGMLLIGGEPALVPDRIAVFAEEFPYVTVATNGTRPIPHQGLEHLGLLVSVWNGGEFDDRMRGHRPGGGAASGLFGLGLRAYRNDPRATWVYTLTAEGLSHMESTVQAIAGNGNQVVFGAYSDYGSSHPVRIDEDRRILDEILRLLEAYPETVIGHPYYYETLISGRSHWASFGYDTCACVSRDYPGNAERLENGHRVMPQMNTYRSDYTVRMCPLSGDCDGCRDTQATWVWILANMSRFLESTDRLRTWVEMAECYWRQFTWSPFHPAARTGGGVKS